MPSRRTPPRLDTSRWLPLKPDVFTILLVLLEGPTHGYRMIKAADERAGRPGQLQPGALYRLLKRLLDEGLVEEAESPADDDDPRRRYYAITRLGRAVAQAEAQRMEALVAVSRRHRLLGKEHG